MAAEMREGRELVGKAIDLLSRVLGEYIEKSLAGRIAVDDWTELLELKDQRDGREVRNVSKNDLVAQIRILTTSFTGVGHFFELNRAQNRYLGEIREFRNAWAHNEEFVEEDVYRAVDTMARLLRTLQLEDAAREMTDLAKQTLVVAPVPEIAAASTEATSSVIASPDEDELDQPWPDFITAAISDEVELVEETASVEIIAAAGPLVDFDAAEHDFASLRESNGVVINLSHQEVLNYATVLGARSAENGRNIVQSIEIEFPEANTRPYALTLELHAATGPISLPEERVVEFTADTITLVDFDVNPDPAKFLGMTERQPGYIQVTLSQRDEEVAVKRFNIEILPPNHWQGNGRDADGELLATFVQPQHPEIAAIVSRAHEVLKERTGDSAMDAYQGPNDQVIASRVDLIVESIYAAVSEAGIRYSNPPASWSLAKIGGQYVRNPHEVLVGKVGTCLDTTVLLAAALEHVGINSIMILVQGHAFLAYSRVKGTLAMAGTTDYEVVRSLVTNDSFRVVETTAMTLEKKAPLVDAASSRKAEYFGDFEQGQKKFEQAIDIAMSRVSGIHALPARIENSDGTVSIHEYTVEKQDPLARFFEEKSTLPVGEARTRETVPPRIARWKNQLLDLSMRNRLLNFTERARFPLGVPENAVEALEDQLNAGKVFELVPGDSISATDLKNYESGFKLPEDRRLELLLEKGKIFTRENSGPYTTTLRRLGYAAKTEMQESGSNNLFLSLGTLMWRDSTKSYRSPLILVPVKLIAGGKGGNYRLEMDSSGESTPNFCLLEKLRQDFKVEIPGLESPDLDASGIDVERAFEAVRMAMSKANLPFSVERTVDLATLQFAKFRLWQDLDENWRELAKNPLVNHLVETPTEVFEDAAALANAVEVNLDDLAARSPVPGDASQLEAVAMAAAGRTFVLEGPPGTGKSQTITNLLATAMAQGKRVLFVAEKRAALEVVQKRLAAAGLEDFTLDLHDRSSKVNDVRRQIQESIDYYLVEDNQAHALLQADIESSRKRLDTYASRLHLENAANMSVYTSRTQELTIDSNVRPLPVPFDFLNETSEEGIRELRVAFSDIVDAADLAHPKPKHPWGFIDAPVSDDDLVALGNASEAFSNAVGKSFSSNDRAAWAPLVSDLGRWEPLDKLARVLRSGFDSTTLREALTERWLTASQQFVKHTGDFVNNDALVGRVFNQDVFTLELGPHIAAADEAYNAGFLGIGRKKRLAAVSEQLGSSWIGTEDDLSDLPETLRSAETHVRNGLQLRDDLTAIPGISLPSSWLPVGTDSVALVESQVEKLRAMSDVYRSVREELSAEHHGLLDSIIDSPEALESAATIDELREAWSDFEAVVPDAAQLASWSEGKPLVDCWNDVDLPRKTKREGKHQLNAWNAFITALEPLRKARLDEARQQCLVGEYPLDWARQGFEKGLAAASLEERLESTGLVSFDVGTHERHVGSFTKNSAKMRKHMKWWLPKQIMKHRESRGFDPVRYGEMTRQLRRQRGGLGVRGLMQEYGDIITAYLPCTLVSPESVARFFPARSEMFDLVVFDEASQVRVADAVGAIGRGKATVIVGDSKQMPPTSIAAIGATEDEELPEGLVADEESILSECEQARLPRLWLSWHYRSQDESLIAFSNTMYYENKLASFPAPRLAEKAAEQGYGVSLVRVDGHFYRQGDRGVDSKLLRTNPIEATVIVDKIRELFDASPKVNPSVGVVTFNLPQRTLIESMIRDLNNTRISESLDDMDGLFIKNLENVQGDERDVILFSTAFAKNENGVLPLNFGPLNNPGGERRLNVAVTRARRQVIVFSSFDPSDLRSESSSSLGIKHLRNYLDFAASGIEAIPASAALAKKHDRHRDQIAQLLRERGYAVQTNVGMSEFKIDISVAAAKAPDQPVLAILLDNPDWAERRTVSDRDALPKEVLESVLKWPASMRIWLPQWLKDSEAVLRQIDETVSKIRVVEAPVVEVKAISEAAPFDGKETSTGDVPPVSPDSIPRQYASLSPVAVEPDIQLWEVTSEAPQLPETEQELEPEPVAESEKPSLSVPPTNKEELEREIERLRALLDGTGESTPGVEVQATPQPVIDESAQLSEDASHHFEVKGGASETESALFSMADPAMAATIYANADAAGYWLFSAKDESLTLDPRLKQRMDYSPSAFDPAKMMRQKVWYQVDRSAQIIGGRADLDNASNREIALRIRMKAKEIMFREWPLKKERLGKLLVASFGMQKAPRARVDSVLAQLDMAHFYVDQNGFIWPRHVQPDDWFEFRSFKDGQLPPTEVSPAEIANAMAAHARRSGESSVDGLKEAMKDVLGFKRMGPEISAWLELAIKTGLNTDRLRREGNRILPAGKWDK